MEILELDFLAIVVGGGENVTTTTASVNTPLGGGSVTREDRFTDNQACRRDVQQACNDANPGFLGFGVNRPAAAACFVQNFPKCPPSP